MNSRLRPKFLMTESMPHGAHAAGLVHSNYHVHFNARQQSMHEGSVKDDSTTRKLLGSQSCTTALPLREAAKAGHADTKKWTGDIETLQRVYVDLMRGQLRATDQKGLQ
jgi:hypothetical protein